MAIFLILGFSKKKSPPVREHRRAIWQGQGKLFRVGILQAYGEDSHCDVVGVDSLGFSRIQDGLGDKTSSDAVR